MRLNELVTLTIVAVLSGAAYSAPSMQEGTLAPPSGEYAVGYQDFNWTHTDLCPDVNFTGTNQSDFSPENINYCHETLARIYYPTPEKNSSREGYYAPFVKTQQQLMRFDGEITKDEIAQLSEIQTYSTANMPVATGTFPVILFAPGFTMPAQVYENSIAELASHGYIVVGINSPFINLVALPNGHVVKPSSTQNPVEIEQKYIPIEKKDVLFTLHQLSALHDSNTLFKAMDLKHVGAFGHSVGARIVADLSHQNPALFNAAATFDIGFDTTGESTKQFTLPFMHQVGANRMTDPQYPVNFELGPNNYLVVMSPGEFNQSYSKHMNFSDLSTLQYLPAYTKFLKFLKQYGMDIIGYGDGWKITSAINQYSLRFFDMYLKDHVDADLQNCKISIDNTYMKCH